MINAWRLSARAVPKTHNARTFWAETAANADPDMSIKMAAQIPSTPFAWMWTNVPTPPVHIPARRVQTRLAPTPVPARLDYKATASTAPTSMNAPKARASVSTSAPFSTCESCSPIGSGDRQTWVSVRQRQSAWTQRALTSASVRMECDTTRRLTSATVSLIQFEF